jgi:hypothetical protein
MATAGESQRHRSEGCSLCVAPVCTVSDEREVDNDCGHLK